MSGDASDDETLSVKSASRFLAVELSGIEDLEDYRIGGFHPVDIGDEYDLRYKVVHKLGIGGFSTVWLARDNLEDQLVALKIVTSKHTADVEAKAATFAQVSTLTGSRRFHIDGPNGRHLCLVLPFLGPSGSELSQELVCRLRPAVARRASHQAVQAVASLHAKGYCHGDVTTANLVFGLKQLDKLSETEIYKIFGEPRKELLQTETGELPGPEVPRFVVETLDFLSSTENFIEAEISLIDVDQSFPTSAPPQEMLGTPTENLAPEVAVGLPASPASDVWALGCTLFRLRSGRGLFSGFEVTSPASLLTFIVQSLGDMPEAWQRTLFDDDGQPTKDPSGEILEKFDEPRPIRSFVDDIYDEPLGFHLPISEPSRDTRSYDERENKPLNACFADLVWKPAATKIGGRFLCSFDDETEAIMKKLPKISQVEAALMYDMLSKIFVYEPDQRITAEALAAHPWFHMDSESEPKKLNKRKCEDEEEGKKVAKTQHGP